jgi:hypothetical protein
MPAQDDLAAVLDQIQARLSAIEGKVGIDGPPPPVAAAAAPAGALTKVCSACIKAFGVILPLHLFLFVACYVAQVARVGMCSR